MNEPKLINNSNELYTYTHEKLKPELISECGVFLSFIKNTDGFANLLSVRFKNCQLRHLWK